MGRARGAKQYFNFTKGWVTEASPMSFPENTAKDLDNVILDLDGSIRRRPGVDFESDVSRIVTNLTDTQMRTQALGSFTWKDVAGTESTAFIVTQQGTDLYINRQNGSASSGSLLGTVDFSSFATNAAEALLDVVQVANGLGVLFVTGRYINPFYVEWDGTSFTTTAINSKIRDFTGIDDSLEVNERPLAPLSASHAYNLFNQGWDIARINTYSGATPLAGTVGTNVTISGTGSSFPSNADIVYLGMTTNNDGDTVFRKTELDGQTFGNTRAAQGHFILDLFDQDRGTTSAIDGLVSRTQLAGRFSTTAFHNGRAFFSGISDQEFSNSIYFSQQLTDLSKVGNFYQEEDPTAETFNNLLDTDGGYFSIPTAGRILKLIEGPAGILVFATNGVWEVSGIDGKFSSDNLIVRKITSTGCAGAYTVVESDTGIFYWSSSSIMALVTDEISGQVSAQDISKTTIQTGYLLLGGLQIKRARGTYIRGEKKAVWIYSTDSAYDDITDRWKANGVLILDTTLGAFYKYSVSDLTTDSPYIAGIVDLEPFLSTSAAETVTASGVDVTASAATVTVTGESFGGTDIPLWKLLIPFTTDGSTWDLTFGGFTSKTFTDWDDVSSGSGANYSSYLETGYELAGNAMLDKQPAYVFSYLSKTSKTQEPGGYYEVPDRVSSIFADTWGQLSNGDARTTHNAEFYNNQMIVYGGSVSGQSHSAEVRIYDISTNTWSNGTSAPQGLAFVSSVLVGDSMYVTGNGTNNTTDKTFMKYTIPTDTWTTLAPKPDTQDDRGRLWHSGGVIFCVESGFGVNDNTFYEYNISLDTWSVSARTKPSSDLLFGYNAHVYNDAVYFLGRDPNVANGPDKFIHTYSMLLDSWSTAATTMPTDLRSPVMVGIGSQLFCFRGSDHSSGLVQDETWRYNITSDTWTRLADFPNGADVGSSGHSATVGGSTVYVYGGFTTGSNNDRGLYEYKV